MDQSLPTSPDFFSDVWLLPQIYVDLIDSAEDNESKSNVENALLESVLLPNVLMLDPKVSLLRMLKPDPKSLMSTIEIFDAPDWEFIIDRVLPIRYMERELRLDATLSMS